MATLFGRRGIFLVSVMFVSMVVAMFVMAALSMAPSSLYRTQHQARRQAAERAIHSGMDYALARVRATPGGWWRADEARQTRLDGLVAEEGDGLVTGWVRDGALWSRFRINFNRQDGPGGQDGMADAPTVEARIGLSCNNLPFNNELAVPAVSSPAATRFQLPPHCLLMSVEGACGSVDASGATPVFVGEPVWQRAEVVWQLSSQDVQLYDSVASSTGGLDFVVDAGQNVSFQAVGEGEGRLRTKAGLSVTDKTAQGAALVSPRGEIRTAGNGNQVGSTTVAANIVRKQENPSDALYSIALDSAPRTGAGAAEIPAGVYEVDLVNGQPELKYYAMNYAEYKAQRLAGTLTGGTVVTLDSSVQVRVLPRQGQDGVEIQFTEATTVKAMGSQLKGLAIVPAKGAFQEADLPLLQAGGGGGGGSVPPSLVYLALLANRIQNRLGGGGGIQTGSQTTPITDPNFTALLQAYQNGPGTLNTGGPDIYFNAGTNQLTGLDYFDVNSWDGLPGIYNYNLGSLQIAQHMWLEMAADPSRQPALEAFMGQAIPTGFGGTVPQYFDVGFAGPTDVPETLPDTGGDGTPSTGTPSAGLAVKDLKIKLERTGQGGESVVLRGSGDITLAGMLDGRGGAVVAEGNLALLGNGLDLEASQAAASSINLYSAGNILIDGFAFDDSSSRYNPISLKGVMYSWGDITVNAGNVGSNLPWADFSLWGSMVAYGRDPADPAATANPRNIKVVARHAELTFDPAYMFNLNHSPVNPNSSFRVRAYHQR